MDYKRKWYPIIKEQMKSEDALKSIKTSAVAQPHNMPLPVSYVLSRYRITSLRCPLVGGSSRLCRSLTETRGFHYVLKVYNLCVNLSFRPTLPPIDLE